MKIKQITTSLIVKLVNHYIMQRMYMINIGVYNLHVQKVKPFIFRIVYFM